MFRPLLRLRAVYFRRQTPAFTSLIIDLDISLSIDTSLLAYCHYAIDGH
jgi:hypothetical protein